MATAIVKAQPQAASEKTALLTDAGQQPKIKSYWQAAWSPEMRKKNFVSLFYREGAIRSGPSINMLDGLRACAYLWVLVLHFSQRTKVSLGVPDAQQGVTVFFVLSGYLIAMVVMSALRKQPSFWKCYAKFLAGRFFRIWPAYIVSIVCLQVFYS
eukprot:SAG31_NODE_191_length_20809_cov_64.613761_1_plen_154_part_10